MLTHRKQPARKLTGSNKIARVEVLCEMERIFSHFGGIENNGVYGVRALREADLNRTVTIGGWYVLGRDVVFVGWGDDS